MAGFFQQLIDLGEEKPSVATGAAGHSADEIAKMSRDDLIAEVLKLQIAVAEKETERRQVQEEALANQSKHEAYRKNVDMWQGQMKEMRAADKKMIDELRAAGSTGKIDDAYVKSTNETIEGLKQSLKEARDDAAKAYKRQREAEELRTEFEKSSKAESQELFAKFEALRERSRQSADRLEQQVVALTDDNASLRERIALLAGQSKEAASLHQSQIAALRQELADTAASASDVVKPASSSIAAVAADSDEGGESASVASLRAQLDAAEKRIASLLAADNNSNGKKKARSTSASAVTSDAEGTKPADNSNDTATDDREKKVETEEEKETPASTAAHKEVIAVLTAKAAAMAGTVADLKTANEALSNEVTTLKIQLVAAAGREEDAESRRRKAEERLQRLDQDVEWAKVEAEKKALEGRSFLDSAKAKIQQSEAKLEAKEEEMRTAERQHKRVVRDLEDAIAAEKDKYAQLTRRAEEKEQALAEQVQSWRERAAADTDKAGEAEETTRRTSEALESQRMHYEVQLAQRDTRIQELYGVRQALEAALQEARDDARRLEDASQELRHEAAARDDQMRLAEQSQSELQRAIVAREEDLRGREKERQALRARLRDEEDRSAELQSVLRELELRITELDVEAKRREQQKTFTDAELVRLQNTIEGLHDAAHSHAALLQVKEGQLAEATRRLQGLGVRNADIARLREDQMSAIRAYEKRIAELEKQLAMAQSSTLASAAAAVGLGGGASSSSAGSAGGGSGAYGLAMPPPLSAGGYASQLERRQQMLSEAFASAKNRAGLGTLSSQQVRLLVVAGVVLVVFVSIINGLRSLAAAGVGTTELDSLSIVREKYAQTLQSLTLCQEQLVASGRK